ncbi:MAG TPA: hypothetical protein VGP68_05770, partial [Gemmataceae bacterium]|nr:hypothetical protein [Gemmataceae bacterium]
MLAERTEPLIVSKQWRGEDSVTETTPQPPPRVRRAQSDPGLVRWGLTALALGTVGLLVIVPVVHVFYQAFGTGVAAYVHSLVGDPDTRHAIFL